MFYNTSMAELPASAYHFTICPLCLHELSLPVSSYVVIFLNFHLPLYPLINFGFCDLSIFNVSSKKRVYVFRSRKDSSVMYSV